MANLLRNSFANRGRVLFFCALLWTDGPWPIVLCVEGFVPQPDSVSPIQQSRTLCVLLGRGRKSKKNSKPGGASVQKPVGTVARGKRQQQQPLATSIETTPITIGTSKHSTTIHVAQIRSDDPWWKENNDNPYGVRVWPASFGVANYIWEQGELLQNREVFEVGCGTGLISQTAAVAGASTVLATDISPVVLDLTRKGWQRTIQSSSLMGSPSIPLPVMPNDQGDNIPPTGRLRTELYDIHTPLPTTVRTTRLGDATAPKQPPLLVASCVLYEGPLGVAMAHRIREAYDRGIWILLGDDDTGYRDGGRAQFLQQMGRQLEWQHGHVKCADLGWRDKPFSFLELNRPDPNDQTQLH